MLYTSYINLRQAPEHRLGNWTKETTEPNNTPRNESFVVWVIIVFLVSCQTDQWNFHTGHLWL